jgi:hypothetical protein
VYIEAMRPLVAALVLACVLATGASAAVSQSGPTLGAQRIAVVLATWGPEPVSVEEARRAIAETEAYIREASFGRSWLDVELRGWVRALPARPTGCNTTELNSTIQGVLDTSAFARTAYVLPQIDCPWGGAYAPPGVWMIGRITMQLFAHELGHNYGTYEEGAAWVCGGGCRVEEYASPYSVMGHGTGHFNAYEKFRYGWIERAVPLARAGDYEIARIDRPSELPHALVVHTGGDEYWIEHRPEVDWPVVHAGPSVVRSAPSRFPESNLLLLGARSKTFSVPGAFQVALVESDGESATLRLRWTDMTKPSRPQVEVETRRRTVTLRFSAQDAGSGVDRFVVTVDGRRRVLPTAALRGRELLGLVPRVALPRGRHRVTVRAVDRAGNVGPARSLRVG